MTSTLYEPIMNALLTLLQNNLSPTPFAYISRRFITWETMLQCIQSGIAPIPQPALLLYDGVGFGGGKIEYEQRGRGRPPVRVMTRTLVVYAAIPGGHTPGGPDFNTTPGGSVFAPLVEAIENVFLKVDSENALTLGGLVSHAWIKGSSHWVTGDIDPDGQGMFYMNAEIMIP